MRKQTSSAVPVMIATGIAAAAIVAVVVYVANQPEAGPPAAVPKAPAASVKPAGPTPEELAKQEAERKARQQTAELQAKLEAIPEPKEPPRDSIPGNAVPRNDFIAAVMGKSPDEVVQLYGRPDSSAAATTTGTTWFYQRRTYDPNTEKPDRAAALHFGLDRKVESVNCF